jgi:hypothetical protein
MDRIIESVRSTLALYSKCFIGKLSPNYWRKFIWKIVGAHTDHASDQKLLVKLFTEWKRLIDRELRGEEALLASKSPLEILQLISTHIHKQAGAPLDWERLPEEEQVRLVSEAWRSICIPFGEESYRKLSPEEQHKIDMFVWGGCCMHKSHNATQAGYDAMTKAWASIKGAVPPVRLITMDNRALADKGSAAQRARINQLAKGGAVAHNSIMAMVMHHKDDKKGQQDVFKNAFLHSFGFVKTFPEVQTARFGSNLQCSVEKVVNRDFYIKFMQELGDSKAKLSPAKSTLTNLEENVKMGLECLSTLTEDWVAAMYCESVDLEYLARVRGGTDVDGNPENLLDLGPLHTQLLDYIKNIADNPDAALKAWSEGMPNTFLNRPIKNPEVYRAMMSLAPQLPHLPAMIQAFFRGAHTKWLNFVTEFAENGQLSKMSKEDRAAAFLSTTNDLNEGALGMLRVALRKMPNLSLQGYNARMLLRKNNLVGYMRALPPEAWRFCEMEARRQARGGLERKRRLRMAEARVQRARANAKIRTDRAKKREEQQRRTEEIMAGVQVELDEKVIADMKGEDLNLQIKWYRRLEDVDENGEKFIQIPPCSRMKVPEKCALVQSLALKYRMLHGDASVSNEAVSGMEEVAGILVVDEDWWEEEDDDDC